MAPYKTLGEETSERLKQFILTGKYAPGQRLPYDQVTKDLEVSQTPLKEAFLRLEKEGLVIIKARRGVFVKKFTKRDIKEFYEIREMLEALSARLAAQLATKDDIKNLRSICEDFKCSAEEKDINLCLNTDIKFHEEIVKISKNKKLQEIIQSFVLTNLFSIAGRGYKYLEKAEEIQKDHCLLVDMIATHNAELAERAMREQIKQGGQWILSSLEK